MEENKLQSLLNLYDSLNNEDKRSFVRTILLGQSDQNDKSIDKQYRDMSDFLSCRLDVTQTGRPACPHCGSLNVVRNGTHEGSQRFRCRNCGKTLGWRTKTFLSHSRKTMEQWLLFLDCFMDKLPLRRTAGICGISLQTAFRWRHKILDGLQSIHAQVKLDGVVQADETYFPKSFKGAKRPEGEKPKARGEAASKRGLSRELVCVPCAVNLTGQSSAVVSNLGRPSTRKTVRITAGDGPGLGSETWHGFPPGQP